MLWTIATFGTAIERLFGYGLMITGGATCIWMPLSRLKWFETRKAFGIICCALLLVTALYKMMSDPSPQSATASPQVLMVQPPSASVANSAMSGEAVEGSIWPNPKTGDRSLAAARNGPAKKPAEPLSDRYVDNANGFSMQFPIGWTSRTFASGEPWFVDVSDGKTGLISVGFSPFPSSAGLDQLKAQGLKNHLQARHDTKFTSDGVGSVDGQPGRWIHYTGPVDTSTGRQVLEVVHYYVPLHDGRMLELRLAAAPSQFGKLAPLLKKSAATLKLMPL